MHLHLEYENILKMNIHSIQNGCVKMHVGGFFS